MICKSRQSPCFAIPAKHVRMLPTDATRERKRNAEIDSLLATSGRTQEDVAAYLSRRLGRDFQNYQISRMAAGTRKVSSDEMDALRELAAQPAQATPAVHALVETTDVIPLFGYANGSGNVLRLDDEQRVGVVPIHPAQLGSRSAFAFIVFGDSMSERMNHGEVGYAIRGRPPFKGQPCVIEMASGEALVKIYEGQDEHTLFARQLSPKKTLSFHLKDVQAVHAVVGASFGHP